MFERCKNKHDNKTKYRKICIKLNSTAKIW